MAKVLIFSQDVIGKTMAGPGIRYWEFANAVAKHHDVTLAAPNVPDISTTAFTITSYHNQAVGKFLGGYDVIITQSVSPAMAYIARRHNTRIILDYYDPILLENLEVYRNFPIQTQQAKNSRFLSDLKLSLTIADSVICASDKQRDLWIGSLMAMNRITPEAYLQDETLHRLIDIVPFGIADAEPKKNADGFRTRLGIKPKDTVIIWGGGIWNWFDPLTLIKAVAKLNSDRSDIKLVFMGLKHPNDDVPEMEMASKAVELAKKLGLYDKHVFFNYGWVAYDERQNHFLEADIGASTHFKHLETRFSFRTRILDYFWTELPVLATEGDSMADLIAQRNLGIVVPYEDVDATAQAIQRLADDKNLVKSIKTNLKIVRNEFRWGKVTGPIIQAIAQTSSKPSRLTMGELKQIVGLYQRSLNDIRKERGLVPVVTNIAKKAYKLSLGRN